MFLAFLLLCDPDIGRFQMIGGFVRMEQLASRRANLTIEALSDSFPILSRAVEQRQFTVAEGEWLFAVLRSIRAGLAYLSQESGD